MEAQERTADARMPESALRDLRGSTPASHVALKAGITPAELSRFESGDRPLTPAAARKLAPVLGVSEEELWTAEHVSSLRRAALKGTLDPTTLLNKIMELAYALPDSKQAERLAEMLLSVLGEALEKDDAEAQGRKGASTATGVPTAALKSDEARRPDRDAMGRRRSKPYGKRGS